MYLSDLHCVHCGKDLLKTYWQVGDLGLRQNIESHIIRKYIIEENENLYPKLTRKMVNQDI